MRKRGTSLQEYCEETTERRGQTSYCENPFKNALDAQKMQQ